MLREEAHKKKGRTHYYVFAKIIMGIMMFVSIMVFLVGSLLTVKTAYKRIENIRAIDSLAHEIQENSFENPVSKYDNGAPNEYKRWSSQNGEMYYSLNPIDGPKPLWEEGDDKIKVNSLTSPKYHPYPKEARPEDSANGFDQRYVIEYENPQLIPSKKDSTRKVVIRTWIYN